MTTVLASLNASLHASMENSERVFVIGEDILDPYGGAFKVTKGLSTRFPNRVLTTPISEAAIVGIATGMAMRGFRPVAEIMFGDFTLLAGDQLVNHASKFAWMYNGKVSVPLVVRTPMGGRRGYGPTHSQTLEKMLLGVPGLRVVAVSALGDPGALLAAAIATEDPVLFIEHKLLYAQAVLEAGQGALADFEMTAAGSAFPTYRLRFTGQKRASVTIACYGYMFDLVRSAALSLALDHEVFCEIIVLSQLSPFELDPLFHSVRGSQRLVVAEEGGLTLGWGAEIVTRVVESGVFEGAPSVRRVAALDLPIANSKPLEDATLPSADDIVSATLELTNRKMSS